MVVERWTYVRILSCKEGWTVVTKFQGPGVRPGTDISEGTNILLFRNIYSTVGIVKEVIV